MEEESETQRESRLTAWGRDDFSVFKMHKGQTVEIQVGGFSIIYYFQQQQQCNAWRHKSCFYPLARDHYHCQQLALCSANTKKQNRFFLLQYQIHFSSLKRLSLLISIH